MTLTRRLLTSKLCFYCPFKISNFTIRIVNYPVRNNENLLGMPKVYLIGVNRTVFISQSTGQVDYAVISYFPSSLADDVLYIDVLQGSVNIYCQVLKNNTYMTVMSLNTTKEKTAIKLSTQANSSNLCGLKTIGPENSLFAISLESFMKQFNDSTWYIYAIIVLLAGATIAIFSIIIKKKCTNNKTLINEKDINEMMYANVCKRLESMHMEDRKVMPLLD